MQNFRLTGAMVSEFRFFKKKMANLRKTCLPVFRTSYDIFIYFWHAVTFSHVLHLDVVRSQIELKLKVKTEISLCMAIIQNNPLPSLYTQYYRYVSIEMATGKLTFEFDEWES